MIPRLESPSSRRPVVRPWRRPTVVPARTPSSPAASPAPTAQVRARFSANIPFGQPATWFGLPATWPAMLERREHRRVSLDCQVGLETETNFYSGFAWDISSGGLFVTCFEPLDVGDRVDVSFRLEDGPRIDARATVRWVRDADAPGAMPGVGLCFDTLSADADAAIRRFIESRAPIFHDV